MKYYVTLKIEARYVVGVEADNVDDARDRAIDEYMDADFGEAQDIEAEPIIVEDDLGNYVWEY